MAYTNTYAVVYNDGAFDIVEDSTSKVLASSVSALDATKIVRALALAEVAALARQLS